MTYPLAYAIPLAPSSDFLVVVLVTDGVTFSDTIRFADHVNDLNGGN
jgi:hypothetical protein